MPIRATPYSLKELCLYNVASHINLWCADLSARDDVSKNHFLRRRDREDKDEERRNVYVHTYKYQFTYVVGPFKDLPSTLIHDLFELICQEKKMHRIYLDMLIDDRITQLDLGLCPTVEWNDGILDIVKYRCPNLTDLSLKDCQQISARMMTILFSSLTNLKKVNLSKTKCNDQVMLVLARYCHKLEELNVSNCPHVTDRGVYSLLVDFENGGVKCPNLVKLFIADTMTTIKSVRIVLKNRPNLRLFDSPLTCYVMAQLHHKEFNQLQGHSDPSNHYHLQSLEMSGGSGEMSTQTFNQCIAIATSYCPYVTRLSLMHDVTNESLPYLCTLQQLKDLGIGFSNESLTFDGLLPVLQARGAGLECLQILEVPGVHIPSIGYLCPQLRELTISTRTQDGDTVSTDRPTSDYLTTNDNPVVPFAKLIALNIQSETQPSLIDKFALKLLLQSCTDIRSINMVRMENLTSGLLGDIYTNNPMDSLESMSLLACSSVTAGGIWPLLNRTNKLQTLLMIDCDEVYVTDYEEMLQKVYKERYLIDLNISWSEEDME